MLTCKEASYLASKAMDEKLTWRERLGLGLHIAMCSICRRYVRNVKKLRAMMRQAAASGQLLLPENVRLSEMSRERIKQLINKALHPTE